MYMYANTQRIHVHTCKVNLTFLSLNSGHFTGVQACFFEHIFISFILFIVSSSKVTLKRTFVPTFTAHPNGGDKYIRKYPQASNQSIGEILFVLVNACLAKQHLCMHKRIFEIAR